MRKLITTKTFDKKFAKLFKNDELLKGEIINTLKSLSIDLNDIKLKTHNSINYSYRIVFRYDQENIFLETIGDHDAVY